MAIDDPIGVQLRQLQEDSAFDPSREFSDATISGLLNLFPLGGPAIDSLLKGRANRNVYRRLVQLFEEIRRRLDDIQRSVPDEEFFGSEEFQTLLALAIQSLQTTHDEDKRKMLARALANSGSEGFHDDSDKEQYVRTIRDLSPLDIRTLNEIFQRGSIRNLRGRILSSISRLISLGLVSESLVSKRQPAVPSNTAEAARAFVDIATQPPDREYGVSEYGERFLKFIS